MSAMTSLDAEIIGALAQSEAVKTEFGDPVRIVEGETARAAFPFIRLARHEVRPETSPQPDLISHRISLEIFSRAGGRQEAGRLSALVEAALRQADLTPEGHHLVLFHPVYSDIFLRADGTTFRGLLRLRAVTEAL